MLVATEDLPPTDKFLQSQPLTFNDPLDNLHPPTYSLFLPLEELDMGGVDYYFDFNAYYHDDVSQ